ncbi:SERINE-THREONINE PROTEIN KINASE [Salix koriyanagi]|uniref:SERINE-THREONINE PROTEIN KINASE n=1 Tax=Salix koriyanagi TaxID=2511006 RepID=A0A9Q0X1B3_9ROSI|nr:SERINE-THREONINE PROTEIN KINASE [Salix koriyanagi]
MAAALECWSSRASTDEDMVEQVLMRAQDRSETSSSSISTAATSLQPFDQISNLSQKDTISSSSAMQKRLQRLSRNVSEALASLKNSLNLDSPRDSLVQLPNSQQGNGYGNKSERCRKVAWASVVRNLTQLYPGSQLPEKLVSNIRKHYDSLPLSYAQAGFDMKEVFLHIKLIEQASVDEQPAIMIQEVSDDEVQGCVYKLTFACNSSISWPAMSGALDSASIRCKKIQIFEKKGFTLGVLLLLVQAGQEKSFKARIESALKSSVKKSKSTTVKLPFGLCGCQEENTKGNFGEIEEDSCEQNCRNAIENSNVNIQLEMPLPTSSIVVSVDEWQTINSGRDEIGKWLLNSDNLEFIDQIGPNSFKGVHKGKRVGIEKLKGCDKGNSYEFELRKDLLELMTCGHKNILQFYGICVDENHGLCVVTRLMEGGSVNELMLKNKKLQTKEIVRIATDVAEGMKFMNDHGVAYRDLNTQRILLDRHGNACLGDMGIVTACKSMGEAMEYETDGYRWLAPEIIAGDPENITETWMSNAYSFGMVVWEMVTGEAAYAAFSPVQAAVGIAACGLRPEISKDCPQILKSLMTKCWNNSPSKRPKFSEIISILLRPSNNVNR